MKRLLLLFLLADVGNMAAAQDTIRTIDGRVMATTIKNATPFELSYIRWGKSGKAPRPSASGAQMTRSISTSVIQEVIYADGRRDSLIPKPKAEGLAGKQYFTPDDFYMLGENDAEFYYRGYKGASTATFLSSFPGSPLLGLFVAAGTSQSPPSPKRFTYPNNDLLVSQEYKDGYAKQAHRIKSRRVWTSWGAGSALTVVSYFMITSFMARRQ